MAEERESEEERDNTGSYLTPSTCDGLPKRFLKVVQITGKFH